MRRMFLSVLTLSLVLLACGSDSGKTLPTSTVPETVSESTSSAKMSDMPVGVSEYQMGVYDMVMQYLGQTLATSPGLREAVPDVEKLATCMVLAGYQMNNIPPVAEGVPTTVVPPETIISPMLGYLAENCSGVKASNWIDE